MFRTLLSSASALVLSAGIVVAEGRTLDEPVPIGILFSFTGPEESLTPDVAASAEFAFDEVNASGLFLGGRQIKPVRGDSTCTDAGAATTAAEQLVTSVSVVAILGAACSAAASAVVSNITSPNRVLALSPSATRPGLSQLDDAGPFYRVAPCNVRQGEVLADAFSRTFAALGGKISACIASEDGKADYSAEVAALAASGVSDLVVIGYLDQGGRQIIQASLDLGAFDRFILPDGMIGDKLMADFGTEREGSFETVPSADNEAAATFQSVTAAAGIRGNGPFRGESYDAAALIALAIQSAGDVDRKALAEHRRHFASAPGSKINVGELAKDLRILSQGGEIDSVGVSNVELDDVDDASGTYRELEVGDSTSSTINV